VFLRQSRLPGVVQMDLRAATSANTVTVRKIEALIARYGADAVKTVMSRVLDTDEELVRQRLREIPDGMWSHRLYAEASHTGDTGLYRYQLNLRKRGDELFVDNAGTDPQAGSINVTYAGLVGAFLSALTASLAPDLAGAYGGVYRRVRFGAWRVTRTDAPLRAGLDRVRAAVADPDADLMAIVAALDAQATIGEITGCLREGVGLPADPFEFVAQRQPTGAAR